MRAIRLLWQVQCLSNFNKARSIAMCNASRVTKDSRTAEQNTTLAIGSISTHSNYGHDSKKIGAFHRPEVAPSDCIDCVQTGQKLTLSNIPVAVQKLYGLRRVEVVTFVQGTSWHQDDSVVFERNEATVHLMELANRGVTAFVGVRTPDIKGAADTVMAAAQTAAAKDAGGTEESGAPSHTLENA